MFEKKCRELIASRACAGICCGPLPMSNAFFEKHKERANRGTKNLMMSGNVSLYHVGDRCPFLDTGRRCKIYKDRPEVCRRFGNESDVLLSCPHLDKDGKARTRAERRRNNSELRARFLDITRTLGQFK